MSPDDEALLSELSGPTDDVDLELLLLLARFEASVRWNDFPLAPLDGSGAAPRNIGPV
ncbi:MAG TPA: hypothetical protein VM661_09025 [Candidatus Sulfotelmatobacter sp.]|jgi:hypothetical protein|nr:hypothetical protein [Candidatus Sulfotelmatobacter sp.]